MATILNRDKDSTKSALLANNFIAVETGVPFPLSLLYVGVGGDLTVLMPNEGYTPTNGQTQLIEKVITVPSGFITPFYTTQVNEGESESPASGIVRLVF